MKNLRGPRSHAEWREYIEAAAEKYGPKKPETNPYKPGMFSIYAAQEQKPLQQLRRTLEQEEEEETKQEIEGPEEWDWETNGPYEDQPEDMDVEPWDDDDSLSNLPSDEQMSGPPLIKRAKRKANGDPDFDGGDSKDGKCIV